jgi:hypothetical protein
LIRAIKCNNHYLNEIVSHFYSYLTLNSNNHISTGAVLYCSANGNPMPHMRWETKDGIVANEITGKY